MTSVSEGVTSGITVIELGDTIGAGYCGKLLADYGATVIKVERPGGDALRQHPPAPAGGAWSDAGGLFAFLNTSKQSVTLDWTTADGAAILHRLLETADVFVHSLDAAGREALGMPADGEHEQLVEVCITPCGLTGPYAGDVHVPLTMAALGGWTYPMGDPDKAPLYPGAPYISYLAGTSAAIGALVGLEAKERHGFGQLIEVSELETAAGTIPLDTLHFSYAGSHRHRCGDLYGDNPLAAIYPCADGYVQFQVGFRPIEFFRVIGGDELANDPRFQTPDLRVQNRVVLKELITGWLKDKPRWELFEACAKERLVFAAVPDMAEILELPPHRERDFYVEQTEGPFAGLRFPGPAIRFGEGAWRAEAAPDTGSANAELFAAIGLEPGAVTALREQGVL
ncbi:MAG: CoA transferase [Dehalococcoidia bacterium]|nr:CoA transferase [Dehalococcoidia bacterium]